MISNVSSQSTVNFTSLYVNQSALNFAKSSKNNNVRFNNIKDIIKKKKLDKKRNVDIFLNYDKNDDTFYGVISSKKQGVPNILGNSCNISENKKDVSNFNKWVNVWNRAYSKKELDMKKKIFSMIG